MRTKSKIINLYEDRNIFSIKHVVSINNEEDLNQFWNFLTNSNNTSHTLINIFVTQFYNFALSYLSNDDAEFFEIILEENEDFFYFTLWNKNMALKFKNYLEKTSSKFIFGKNRISVKLVKKKYKSKIEKIDVKNKKREKKLIESVTKNKKIKIEPYTFLEDDDLEELTKLNEDLQDLIYQAKNSGFNDHMFISFRSTFSIFCLTLRYYDKIAPMANTITDFSNLLNTSKDKFTAMNDLEFELVSGFVYNIDRWLRTLFITGGADLYFMDQSIKADYTTISQMITQEETDNCEYDLDDIFMF